MCIYTYHWLLLHCIIYEHVKETLIENNFLNNQLLLLLLLCMVDGVIKTKADMAANNNWTHVFKVL